MANIDTPDVTATGENVFSSVSSSVEYLSVKKGDGHIIDFLLLFDIRYYLICAEKINCIIKFNVRFIVYRCELRRKK